MKKTVYLLLILIGFSESYAQNYWVESNTPISRDFNRLHFLDSLRGWIVGDAGTIIKTTTGGVNWIVQTSGVDSDIYEVFFINRDTGWAITWDIMEPDYYTIILKTTNGGDNWISYQYPEEAVFYNVAYFLNPNTGFLGGAPPNNIVRTTNGGTNWSPITLDSNIVARFPIINFKFYNNNTGYASGGYFDIAGIIWKTTDSGFNWITYGVGPEPVQGLYIFDSLNIIGAGGDYEYGTGIITTSNGGTNWDYRSLETFGIASTVSFRTRAEGWSPLGFADRLVYTKDSSRTWQEWETPNDIAMYDLQFTDKRNGFGCGENGAFFKYNTDLINIKTISDIIPVDFKLFQNYPNPFNPTTKIKFRIAYSSKVSLGLYDIKGSFIKNIYTGNQSAGSYEVTFDGNDLPSGVYIYKFDVISGMKTFSESRKMVLVK